MARKMNAYKKYVFSGQEPKGKLEWNNAEQVLARHDEDIVTFVDELKARPGGNPAVSSGASWFDQLQNGLNLDLASVTPYQNGVLGVRYRPTNRPG